MNTISPKTFLRLDKRGETSAKSDVVSKTGDSYMAIVRRLVMYSARTIQRRYRLGGNDTFAHLHRIPNQKISFHKKFELKKIQTK